MEQLDLTKTYKAAIQNSLGSELFKNLYVKQEEGDSIDVLNDGEYACAFYVSTMLKIFSLISEAHATVDSTLKDLEGSGWQEIETPQTGAVVVWEAIQHPEDDEPHRHIGFITGGDTAVSINYKTGQPEEHSHTPDDRRIEKIFWHKALEA